MTYNWTKYTILVVEDDPINYKFLEIILKKKTGVNLLWGKDGGEAYRQIASIENIDLVLLDYQLPDLNGLDVLTKSKKIRPKLPVIMQTANVWGDDPELCRKAGCDGFFSKPIKIEKLLVLIEQKIKEYSNFKSTRQ